MDGEANAPHFVEEKRRVEEHRVDRRRREVLHHEALVDIAIDVARRVVPFGVVVVGLLEPSNSDAEGSLGRSFGELVLDLIDFVGHLAQRDYDDDERSDEHSYRGYDDPQPEASNDLIPIRHRRHARPGNRPDLSIIQHSGRK